MRHAIRNCLFAAGCAFALSACVATPMSPEMQAYRGDDPTVIEADLGCAPYARQISGIDIRGDAYTWWDQAAGRYVRVRRPEPGALLVLHNYAGPTNGHLAMVTRIVSPREIRVDHANWLNDGNIYVNSPVIDVSPGNDWSEVRVYNNRLEQMGIKNYSVRGFITPTRLAAAMR